MVWTKAKTAVVILILLLVSTLAILLNYAASGWRASQRQSLADGSMLVLNRVVVDSHIKLAHGTTVSKALGNLVPSNGVHLLALNIDRRRVENFDSWGKSWLLAEFRLSGPNPAKHPLVRPPFFRQFRFVIYGESGTEFVEELWKNQFLLYPDGYYGYILARRFPRQSRWLGFRLEQREDQTHGGPWKIVADLKIRNPARTAIQPWVPEATPTSKSASGLELVLGKVTVKPIPYMTNDIWNHIVNAPMEVRSNGMVLTNWSAAYGYVQAEDASGNWDSLASHRSLDPSFVWKLEADFEPQSKFAEENLATVMLPAGPSTIATNIMNVPVTVSWDGYWVDASMPTNQPGLGLKFVSAADDEGDTVEDASGSWGQFRFRKGSFMVRKGNVLTTHFKPTKVTVAVIPKVHATFYTQPQILTEPKKD